MNNQRYRRSANHNTCNSEKLRNAEKLATNFTAQQGRNQENLTAETRRSSLGASRGAELLYGRASVQGKRDTSYSSRNATTGSTVAARREGKYDAAAVTISIRIATLVYTAGSIGLMSKSSVSI